jgi:hypothetical protein
MVARLVLQRDTTHVEQWRRWGGLVWHSGPGRFFGLSRKHTGLRMKGEWLDRATLPGIPARSIIAQLPDGETAPR